MDGIRLAGRRKKYRVNEISTPTSIVLNLICILLCLVCLIPLALVVVASFSSEESLIRNGYTFFPSEWSAEAYAFLFQDASTLVRAFLVSIGTTLVGAFLSVLLMMLYAYPLSRQDFPYKKFFTFLVLITMVFHGGMAPKYITYSSLLNLRDTYIAVILPLLANGFYIFMIRTFFKSTIPAELIEAAKIDGAGEFRIFGRIVVPLSLPVIGTMGLFMTLKYWNQWIDYMLFISDKDMFNLQYVLQRLMKNAQYMAENASSISASAAADAPNTAIQMAMVVISVTPLLVVYPYFQKYFVGGLTVGSVKG